MFGKEETYNLYSSHMIDLILLFSCASFAELPLHFFNKLKVKSSLAFLDLMLEGGTRRVTLDSMKRYVYQVTSFTKMQS